MGLKTAGVGYFTIPTAPAAGTSCTSGAANVFTTTYVQLIASTAAAIYIYGVHLNFQTTSKPTYVAVQLATGGAGSETIVSQLLVPFGVTSGATGTFSNCYAPIYPPIPVANATRIAVKTADSVGALAALVSLVCINQSNIVDDGVNQSANVIQWNSTNVSAPATAGIPDINVKNINNVAAATPGASGGILISGSNAGTTTLAALTVTGTATISDGIVVTRSTANSNAISATGSGSGSGISATGGAAAGATAAGHGVNLTGGAASTTGGGVAGVGVNATGGPGAASTNGAAAGATFVGGGTTTVSGANGVTSTGTGNLHGISFAGAGSGNGLNVAAGATGIGFVIAGGATSGDGIKVTTTSGHGINLAPVGTSKHGFFSTGGNGGVSDGMNLVAGTGGVDLRANQTGSLSGSVGSVTGAVGSVTARVTANADQLAGQTVTAAAGVTFPASVASPTNITSATGIDITKILGTAIAAPATAGILDVNIKNVNNVAAATPGAAGGMLIAGSNAATTFVTLTSTGAFSISGVNNISQTGDSFVRIGANGAGLTAVVAASVTGSVGSVIGLTPGNLDTTVSSRATPTDVRTQAAAALSVDTYAEPGQEVPAATASLATKIGYTFKAWRNKSDQTSGLYQLYSDAGVVDQKASVSDDNVTFTRQEVASGP